MNSKILIYPDYKLYISYNEKDKYWRVKNPNPTHLFIEKSETLSEALENTANILVEIKRVENSDSKKTYINKILKSNFFIKYVGDFYLCIFRDLDGLYRMIYFSKSYELREEKINTCEVDLLLKAIEKLKIQPFHINGFDGKTNSLKLGAGLNSTTINWWSGTGDDWEGLPEVLSMICKLRGNIT